MQQVVVVGATIQCNHGGTAKLPQGDSRLQISNNSVVTAGQEAGISFAPGSPNVVIPCPHTNNNTSPPTPSPCTATVKATAGISTLLVVGSMGVLLKNATGKTVNADPATTVQAALKWSVADAGQTLLSVDH